LLLLLISLTEIILLLSLPLLFSPLSLSSVAGVVAAAVAIFSVTFL
jgi:hypothetical protein